MAGLFADTDADLRRDWPIEGDLPWNLDAAIRTFLNRWTPCVLSAENRPTIEAELRALIQDAKEQP